MAKLIEYDVTGVEESGGGTGIKAPVGLRVAKIMKCEPRTVKRDGSPANDIEIALDVGSEYDWLFTYVGLGPESDWKLAEFIRACQLKEKGKLDPSKQVGKLIRVKVNPGEYAGEYRPEAGKLLAAQDGDEIGSVAQVAETDGRPNIVQGEGEEAVEKTYTNPDFVASREGEEGIGSYDDWSDEDLEAEVTDRDLTVPGGRGSKRNKLIQALRDEDAEISGASAEEPEDEAEATAEFDIQTVEGYEDFDEWSADDVKAEYTERGLAVEGRYSEAKAREAIIAAVAEEQGVAPGGGAAAEGDDYDSWDLDQLKKEWEDREMGDLPAIRGRNAEARMSAAIIEALREDDVANPFS